ncbi:hypothetical protein ACFSTH_20520 [Paenibacillus yanchengensis]|uniref:RNA polymerase subunit sigma n=1 Tax=Paenibacillus yanchengensis TaxID=2035833 RepID=A0ABW4YMI3_9BACL
MSFKPLDMQMSVPRTQDVSILKSQAAQKPIVDQNALAQQSIQETEKMRTESSKLEKSAKMTIKEQAREQKGQQDKQSDQEVVEVDAKKSQTVSDPIHPYKGHHVDISL